MIVFESEVFILIADRRKLELAMSRACLNSKEAAEKAQIPRATFNNVITGRNVRPATLGRIAQALGVDVEKLIAKED